MRSGEYNLGENPQEDIHEKEKGPALEFYFTDHSPDHEDTGNPEALRKLYGDMKNIGVESVRTDWHWRNVEPTKQNYSEEHLARYGNAKQIMEEVGLKEPTIILSNPPEWAKKLYETDKEAFFNSYKQYVETVKEKLVAAGGKKISKVQILNELNNRVYTPVKVEDLPRLCSITREVFRDYNPDIKLMGTVLVSNTIKAVGTPIEQYMPELKKTGDSFDVIAVDYYPGFWHLPVHGTPSLRPSEVFKHMVKQQGPLLRAFEEIAKWGKEYELGEVGLPTKRPWGGERGQRYFYDAFFRAFRKTLAALHNQGLKLPSRIGFYEAIDEPPRDILGKVLRATTPFPEFDMGTMKKDGTPKEILKGKLHLPEEERTKGLSRLQEITRYLNRPFEDEVSE